MGKITRLNGGEGEDHSQGLHLREIPAEASPPIQTVGQDLRNARLTRGEELSHVSHALRISKHYLEALESDRPQKLPGRTYAVGFVRTYANYLGLDAPSLVSRYKLATAGLGESAPQVGPAPEPEGFRLSIGWTLAALAAATFLVVYGIYKLSQPPVPAAPKMASAPVPGEAHRGAPTIRHVLAHAVLRSAPPTPAVAPPPGASAATAPTGQVFGQQNRGARVVLHARALAHVLVDGPGGKVYINRVLHPGDVYRVPNLVGLSLTTPNGDAVSLELDGRDLGAAGKSGHIIEALSLDPATIVDRKSAAVSGESHKVTP